MAILLYFSLPSLMMTVAEVIFAFQYFMTYSFKMLIDSNFSPSPHATFSANMRANVDNKIAICAIIAISSHKT